jgi:hypothetical protein
MLLLGSNTYKENTFEFQHVTLFRDYVVLDIIIAKNSMFIHFMIFWKITTISNTQSHFQFLFSSYNTNYQKKNNEIHIR